MKIRIDNLLDKLGLKELDLGNPAEIEKVKKELDIMIAEAEAEEAGTALPLETYKQIGQL